MPKERLVQIESEETGDQNIAYVNQESKRVLFLGTHIRHELLLNYPGGIITMYNGKSFRHKIIADFNKVVVDRNKEPAFTIKEKVRVTLPSGDILSGVVKGLSKVECGRHSYHYTVAVSFPNKIVDTPMKCYEDELSKYEEEGLRNPT